MFRTVRFKTGPFQTTPVNAKRFQTVMEIPTVGDKYVFNTKKTLFFLIWPLHQNKNSPFSIRSLVAQFLLPLPIAHWGRQAKTNEPVVNLLYDTKNNYYNKAFMENDGNEVAKEHIGAQSFCSMFSTLVLFACYH